VVSTLQTKGTSITYNMDRYIWMNKYMYIFIFICMLYIVIVMYIYIYIYK